MRLSLPETPRIDRRQKGLESSSFRINFAERLLKIGEEILKPQLCSEFYLSPSITSLFQVKSVKPLNRRPYCLYFLLFVSPTPLNRVVIVFRSSA